MYESIEYFLARQPFSIRIFLFGQNLENLDSSQVIDGQQFFQFGQLNLSIINLIQEKMQFQQGNDISKISTIICVAGNDGTGKSSICKFLNEQLRKSRQDIYCIQRSSKNCLKEFKPILDQLKRLDILTYSYVFEDERRQFERSTEISIFIVNELGQSQTKSIKVFWFMLDLQPEKIQKRLSTRTIVDIHDSKKAVEYYSFIYRQFAWYYGIPIVYADQPTPNIVQNMLSYLQSSTYVSIYALRFQSISLGLVNQRNIENQINQSLMSSHQHRQKLFKLVKNDILGSQMKEFYLSCQSFKNLFAHDEKIRQNLHQQQIINFQVKLCARWLIKNGSVSTDQKSNTFVKYANVLEQNEQVLRLDNMQLNLPYLKIYEEGQSKILFTIHSVNKQVEDYFKGKVIILLKSTIYSHTKQHTGQIPNLGKVRALGNILFLEMIRRNNLKHAYLCINHQNGIILSVLVKTNKLQIIFKKQCLGTDKHSYHSIIQIPQIVNTENNCYSSGVYIRFDWRNPNHILVQSPNILINQDSYYYVVEKQFGKEQFFALFLTGSNVKSMGDRCISEDLLSGYAETDKIKKNTLRLYSTFLYYSRQVGLQILDGCFMFDQTGEIGWSQINPDCMRVKDIKDHQDYDKDIWRYGGSAKKQQIFEKWTIFNKLFIDWFKQNRYHQTQLIQLPQLSYPYHQICSQILNENKKISPQYQWHYQQLSNPRWDKRLIGTIDISDRKPILVKSSIVTQSHNDQSLEKAYAYIQILQEIVVVDIDAAIQKQGHAQKNNRKDIKKLINKDRNKVIAVGGGIRSKQVLDHYLNSIKCRKIILSSNLQLLSLLTPQTISQRVIIELSINSQNEVLTNGRSVNTHVNIITKIQQLITLNVKTISITFNNQQGHMAGIPRKQLIDIYMQVPQCVENIIIAGGISSVEDLDFIWGFKRCIPQLGSAIWKRKITLGDIYKRLVKWNRDGLVVTIVVDQFENVLGQVYLNQQALELTCQTRKLHRYSRQHQKVMKKGQTSSNIFDVLDFKLDCDNDSIIVKVKGQKTEKQTQFCHKNQYSCFQQTLLKNNCQTLQAHILSKKQTGSGYSRRMTQNQGLAAMKIIEEVQQLHVSSTNKVHEAADLMSHLMMYFNAHNIQMGSIFKELERRSISKIKIQGKCDQKMTKNQVNNSQQVNKGQKIIGIISGKHFDRIDKLTQEMLGIKLIRATNRSAKIDYQVVDSQIFQKMFGTQKIKLVGIKSKDMSTIVAKSLVKNCINYSIMMQNYPTVCKQVIKLPTPGISLALLGRKDQQIDPKQWSPQRKGIILSQYPFSVSKYFQSIGIDENCYTFVRVSGGTQSYLASQDFKADYCDAIIESGKTVQDNNLKIIAIIQATIYAGYYDAL